MLEKLYFLLENHLKNDTNIALKVEQKCWIRRNLRFLCLCKGYNVKIVFGMNKGTEMYHKIHENSSEIIDRKKGAEMVPKVLRNGSK